MNTIDVSNVKKSYKDFTLNVEKFSLPQGSIVGLIGENGAGKSTLINCILNIVPYEGEIKILGKKLTQDMFEDIGVYLDDAFISNVLTINQIAKVYKKIYSDFDEEYFFSLCDKMKLTKDKIVKDFSKGMKVKVKLASALSIKPKLLVLDEPTTGIDPVMRDEILDLFRDFIIDDENAVLISSHITSDLEKIADYIALMDKGRIVMFTTVDELRDEYGIAKCSQDKLSSIEKNFIVAYKENRYNTEILIKDRTSFKHRYPDLTVDKCSIDELMTLYLRGEKI